MGARCILDIKILRKLKVDYVLVPKIKEIYSRNTPRKISISKKYKVLCGKYRPGHFEGVLAVINKFLKSAFLFAAGLLK